MQVSTRRFENDDDKGSCPHESILRDPPYGRRLDGEPVLQSAGFKDGKKPVEQEEVTPTSSNA